MNSKWRIVNWLLLVGLLSPFTIHYSLFAQQPQAQSGQSILPVNAKYVQGVSPGFWPQNLNGNLTLTLSPGSIVCGTTPEAYAQRTLTMTASSTNYLFLDAPSANTNCLPDSNVTGFPAGSSPIAIVTAGSSTFSIADGRPMGVGSISTGVGNGATSCDVTAPTCNGVRLACDPAGVVDCTAALNAAFQTAHAFVFPTGTYKATAALVPQSQTVISCANSLSAQMGYTGPGTIIHAVHTGNAIFDLSGLTGVTITNCVLEGDATTTPKTCLFMARATNGNSAGFHWINNVSCTGSFSQVGLYNVSSENNEFDNFKIWILGGGALYGIYGSAANDLGIGTTGQGSTEKNIFHNLSLANYNTAGANPALIRLELYGPDLRSWEFDGLDMSISAGRYIDIDNVSAGDSPGPLLFKNVVGEIIAGGSTLDAMRFTNNPIHGLQIHGLNFTTNGITAGQYLICNTSTLDAANISLYAPIANLWNPACTGATTNSNINLGVIPVTSHLASGDGSTALTTPGNTNIADVDATHLAWTVTIPVGWKLSVSGQCQIKQATAAAGGALYLFDSVANTEIAPAILLNFPAVGTYYSFPIGPVVITGDGNSHTVKLQWQTNNGSDALTMSNSGLDIPTISFLLVQSN